MDMRKLSLHVNRLEAEGLVFSIDHQSHRGERFTPKSHFYARNGVCLASVSFPELKRGAPNGFLSCDAHLTLYVCGADRGGDNSLLRCTLDEYQQICVAVQEYNEKYNPTLIPPELFEI